MEEKYNELLEKVKELKYIILPDGKTWNWINDNIPELAENKDERIRKGLLKAFREYELNFNYYKGLFVKDIIKWLEKQEPQE